MNHIRRAIDKINAIPQIYAFLFFEILIAVRVYAEFGRENPLTIAVFQLFWFTSVLIYFFAFFKWMLKLKDEDLTFFALGGFLPMIPVLFAFVVDRELTLNFVEPTSFLAVLKNIFTLEAAHSYNWALFPELLALLLPFWRRRAPFCCLVFPGSRSIRSTPRFYFSAPGLKTIRIIRSTMYQYS